MKINKVDSKKHIIYIKNNLFLNDRKEKQKAIFLDRDGVIIKDVNYIRKEEDVTLLKGVSEFLLYTLDLGYINIIITNQSGISRNFFSWEDYEKVTRKMLKLISKDDAIYAIYANGEYHSNTTKNECWRKPSPNMIFQAAKDFNINLSESVLIGDRLSDIKSGEKAGLKNLIHVLTGHGKNERAKVIEYCKFFNKNYQLSLVEDLYNLKKEDHIAKIKDSIY